MSDFIVSVTDALHDLISSGLLVVESSTMDRNAFGNAIVLLKGRDVRVRVIRDRGQVFVELACSRQPRDWHPLQRVLTALGVAAPAEGPLDVETMGALLNAHARVIEARACAPETESKLAALSAAAEQEVLQRLKGGDHLK